MHDFKYGDRVTYIGMQSPGLQGREGIVTKMPGAAFAMHYTNVPVMWEDKCRTKQFYRGVVPENIRHVTREIENDC